MRRLTSGARKNCLAPLNSSNFLGHFDILTIKRGSYVRPHFNGKKCNFTCFLRWRPPQRLTVAPVVRQHYQVARGLADVEAEDPVEGFPTDSSMRLE